LLYIIYIYLLYTRGTQCVSYLCIYNIIYTHTKSYLFFDRPRGADSTVHVSRPSPSLCDRNGAGHDWLIKASFTCDTYIYYNAYTYKTIPRPLINHDGKEKKKNRISNNISYNKLVSATRLLRTYIPTVLLIQYTYFKRVEIFPSVRRVGLYHTR